MGLLFYRRIRFRPVTYKVTTREQVEACSCVSKRKMRDSVLDERFGKKIHLRLISAHIAIFFILLWYIAGEAQGFPTGVHVDGYDESEVPTYPFQQYIQVRKTYTVEHVPVYHNQESSPKTTLLTSASNNHNDSPNEHHSASATNNDGNDHVGNYYHVPRLREEISDYKKQEVYEEKGYGDSAYDHHRYKEPTKHHHNDDYHGQSSSVAESSSLSKNSHHGRDNDRHRYRHHSLHTPDGSSTKILEYVASNLHDSDAEQKGIYAARSNIYCPEVIDFDLSSKRMAMGKSGNRGAKPRLQGLGSKILCLKNKYFGAEPLPKAIFAEPSESRESVIEAPSFSSFFNMVRHNVGSVSSFQNSNVPV